MKKIVIIITMLFITCQGFSQSIVQGEYFFNTEPGVGNGTALSFTASDSVEFDVNLSLAALPAGFNHLYMRFQMDNGQWGLLHHKTLYVLPTPIPNSVLSGEFFVDTETGVGNGTPFEIIIPADTVEQEFVLELPELELGSHTLYIRYKNESGDWGMLEQRPFLVCTNYGSVAAFNVTSNDDLAFFFNQSQYHETVLWNFGDGTTSTEINPTHQYAEAGQYTVQLNTYNECANDSTTQTVDISGIRAITPNHSANTNFIVATISGAGFTNEMEVKLIKDEEEIIGENVNSNGSHSLTATFNFEGETIGLWDVVVIATGVFSDTLCQGFDMQLPQPIHLSSYISAPPRTLVNRQQKFLVNLTNEGNQTAYGLQHFVKFPKTNTTAKLLSEMKAPTLSDHLLDSIMGGLRITLDPLSGDSIYSGYYIIPVLGPGETSSLLFSVSSSVSQNLRIHSVVGSSIFSQAQIASLITGTTNFTPANLTSFAARSTGRVASSLFQNASISAVIASLMNGIVTGTPFNSPTPAPVNSSFPGPPSLIAINTPVGCSGCGSPGTPVNPGASPPIPGSTQVAHVLFNPFEIPNTEEIWEFTEEELENWVIQDENGEDVPAEEVIEFTEEELRDALEEDLGNDIDDDNPEDSEEEPIEFTPEEICGGPCNPISPIEDNIGDEEDQEEIPFVQSFDPNAIYGPAGFTDEQYVNKNLRMDYRVEFENADTAQANAVEVKVVLPIDTNVFDLSTFRYETFGFGEYIYAVAPFRENFTAEVSMEGLQNCILRISGNEPDVDGIVNITFESLHLETRNLIDNPDDGFLPPNIDAPEGQGFFTFSIRQKNNLPHLTEVSAQAEIIFDANEPIVTNLHQNIVDTEAPQSAVLPLDPQSAEQLLTIDLSKSDAESGVDFVDVYIAINGGDFERITRTNSDSLQFMMTLGNTYGFYTVATDKCGNREDDPGVADATTSFAVSVNEYDFDAQIIAFPIPAIDVVSLEIRMQQAAVISYVITDMTGKTVIASKRINTNTNGFNQQIDISELAAGAYFIKVTAGEDEIVKKLIKQ